MRKSTSFTPMQDLSAALVSLVASTAPSLVSVSSNRSQSSGFVWRPGLIVTADEALSEDGEFTIKLWNGNAVPAQLVGIGIHELEERQRADQGCPVCPRKRTCSAPRSMS